MTLYINGDPIEARGFMWDGCHKIYLIRSDEDLARMVGAGWDVDTVVPLEHLPDIWEQSCGLRFISSGDLSETYVSQDTSEDAVVTVEDD